MAIKIYYKALYLAKYLNGEVHKESLDVLIAIADVYLNLGDYDGFDGIIDRIMKIYNSVINHFKPTS